jgi:hypothetical protein
MCFAPAPQGGSISLHFEHPIDLRMHWHLLGALGLARAGVHVITLIEPERARLVQAAHFPGVLESVPMLRDTRLLPDAMQACFLTSGHISMTRMTL